MTLRNAYEKFLAGPAAAGLAENASINYIPTLTTIRGAAAVGKHFHAQAKQLAKKSEKVLSAIEGQDGLCVDVETTVEFMSGGGAYLPGLDDNFLADRTATFPVVHIVHFDHERKIDQIRLYWDQGSLLKQMEVIGARAKNWPIRDGKDQARLIATSASSTSSSTGPSGSADTTRPQSNRSAVGDPHASLSLFQPRNADEESSVQPASVAPRASAKPPPREYNELFAADDASKRPASESRGNNGVAVKDGAGKNFQRFRLFDENDEPAEEKSPERLKTYTNKYNHFEFGDGEDAPATERIISPLKTNEKKYDHFEFGDGEEAQDLKPSAKSKKYNHFDLGAGADETPSEAGKSPAKNEKKYKHFEFGPGEEDNEGTPKPAARPKSSNKHQSQWDFEDFVTPQKVQPKERPQNARHFGWSDDEDEKSPVRRPVVHQARPDADPHFEFVDDGTPAADKKLPTKKGRAMNANLGLYHDQVTGADDSDDDDEPNRRAAANKQQSHPLSNVTNTKAANNGHRRVFDSQFDMKDSSPAPPSGPDPDENKAPGNTTTPSRHALPDSKKKDASWDQFEQSLDRTAANRGIKTSGDGMGGRKDAGRNWGFGDDSEDEIEARGTRAEC